MQLEPVHQRIQTFLQTKNIRELLDLDSPEQNNIFCPIPSHNNTVSPAASIFEGDNGYELVKCHAEGEHPPPAVWDYIDLYAILQDVTYKSAITILLSGAGLWADNEPAEAPLPIVRPKPSAKYPKQDSYLLYVATDKGVERSELVNARTSNGWMPKGKDSYGLGGVKQKDLLFSPRPFTWSVPPEVNGLIIVEGGSDQWNANNFTGSDHLVLGAHSAGTRIPMRIWDWASYNTWPVLIVADNDKAGLACAQATYRDAVQAGVEQNRIKILSPEKEGWDLSDVLRAEDSVDNLIEICPEPIEDPPKPTVKVTQTSPESPPVKKTKPMLTPELYQEILEASGWTYRYREDLGRHEVVNGKGWRLLDDLISDEALHNYYKHPGWTWVGWRPADIRSARNALARKHSVHLLRDYLDGLPEQQVDIDDLEATALYQAAGQMFNFPTDEDKMLLKHGILQTLWAVVARCYRPGAYHQQSPVLSGPQGIGKTTLWQFLLPRQLRHDYFSSGVSLTSSEKEWVEATRGKAIVELDEMQGRKWADNDKVKSRLSRNQETYREPYATLPIVIPRTCAIVGSTNDHQFLLPDASGNRRILPIEVYPAVSGAGNNAQLIRSLLAKHRDQMWAEAVSLYKQGWKGWTEAHALIHAALKEKTDEHMSIPYPDVHEKADAFTQSLSENAQPMTLSSIAERMQWPDLYVSSLSKSDEMRLSKVLRNIGWQSRRLRVDGKRASLWIPPVDE